MDIPWDKVSQSNSKYVEKLDEDTAGTDLKDVKTQHQYNCWPRNSLHCSGI